MTDSAPLTPLHAVQHTDALPVGTRLGEFELTGLLGVGGFGMVYQAYDHSLQRAVAIKEYIPTALAGRSGDATVAIRSSLDGNSYQAGLQSFVAEARLLAQFDHPSLVKVFRFWEANNTAYMVMPLYVGMTLKQARSQMRSPPSEAWLRQVLWSVLEALKLLHLNQTLHRDVSPDNIFLQDVGPPVLLDLGAARRAIGDLGRKHTAVLKVNYAPIEQYADARDMVQGAWSDLYSLAAVVHGYLANDLPLPATFRVLRDRMPSMQEIAQSVQLQYGREYSPVFIDTLGRSLAIRPEDRPQSVAEFTRAMDLQAPADMARFDWRLAMETGWQLSQDERAVRAKHPPVDLAEQPTQFMYRPMQASLLVQSQAPAVRRVWFPRRAVARVGAVFLLVAVGLGLGRYGGGPSMPVPALVALAPAPAGPQLPPIELTVQAEIVAEPRALPPAEAELPAAPVRKQATPVAAKARQAQAVHAKAAPQAKSSAPVTAKVDAPVRDAVLAPVALCTDSNFFSRPMCMYRECQKPQFADLPACVENTQRWLANQPRRS